ncbi:MAG: 3-phosphoshikimate 1-carboxyvinyltransferase [Candidatus Hadarchaeum sp.]|uniref:3-phosphoshikimate 1-carboxyvinyltransferase n=1 Tax=Candidatus Hadarchaeum sp. TaxID=2883567 RepID=UPI003D14C872
MNALIVRPSKLAGEITAPPSKSYTHRAFMIALLAEGESVIRDPLIGYDTMATIEAVRAMGAEVTQEGKVWRVRGTGGNLRPLKRLIDARNSGTTIRLMSAIAAISPEPIKLTGDQSILQRPMGPLIETLAELGTKARCEGKEGRPPVIVGGGLEGGDVEITGGISSQFISAILLAAPYAKNDVSLTITGELRSKPYVEITLELLERAGAKIKHDGKLMNFKIPGGQTLKPIKITIPGDFSSAAFPLGAAAITRSTVRVNNLDIKGAQGDKRIVTLLKDFGAEVKVSENAVEVSGEGELSGIEADCGDNPDLVPILAVIGAVADGRTRLTNIPHLRFKETDRLRALANELRKLGVEVAELPDELKIEGAEQLRGSKLWSYDDHRMAMALAVAGLVAQGKTIVENVDNIPVSYPGFVEDMQKLGAKIEIVK